MGTIMRFGFAVAGLLCTLFGIGLIAPQLISLIASPDGVDSPLAMFGIIPLTLLSDVAPIALGLMLLGKAFRRASDSLQAYSAREQGLPNARVDAPVRQLSWRRLALVTVGLTLTSIGVLVPVIAIAALATAAKATDGPIQWAVNGVFIALAAMPAALGMWLVHIGDPGIGKRFGGDVVALLSGLRRASSLAAGLRTSFGLGIATLLSTATLMLIWQRGSLMVAMAGLTLYSILDPILNVSRRSWWLGAVLSSGVWIALLTTLSSIANAIAPMREGAMVFLMPMMLFGGAVILSGIVRLASVRRPRAERGIHNGSAPRAR